MSQDKYKYWAFISYSHRDRAWGNWLHQTLETYRVPKRLVGRDSRDGKVPARLFPIFRDRDELPSSADLGGVINQALADSRYQIVICSPRSAASRWVNEEIRHFKSLGRSDRVLCLIVDGEPNVFDVPGRDIEECFAPALRFRVSADGTITDVPAEPIAADAREHADGKAGARLKLLSGLLGVGFDELRQREKQRQFWQRLQLAAASLAFAGMVAGAWQWYTHTRDAREREITIEKLVENGRQELLDGRQARAAVYLNEAYKMGNDSVPVRFMLHQALQPLESLTDVRVKYGGKFVHGAEFSPDDRRFVLDVLADSMASRQQASAKVYDASTGSEVANLPDAPPLPLAMLFMPDGMHLLINGFPDEDKAGYPITCIWDLNKPGKPLTIRGINGLAGLPLNPTGTTVLIAGEAGLELRDTSNGKLVSTYAPGRNINATSFSPDGRTIALADSRGVIEIIDSSNGRAITKFSESDGQSISAVMYTPTGDRLLAMSAGGDIRIWDIASGQLRVAFAADPTQVTKLQFNKDGRRLVTVGAEGYRVWSTARGSLLFFIQKPLNPLATAALSPDGDTLITAEHFSGVSEVWDVLSKRKLYSLDYHAEGISSATFNAAGTALLLASQDGQAEIWRMPVKPSWKYESFEKYPYSAHFDRKGQRLLAAGGDANSGRAMIFSVAEGKLVQEFNGHKGLVYEASFDPSDKLIATASQDGTAGLWELNDGQRIATMTHRGYAVSRTRFSPDGTRLVTLTSPAVPDHPDAAGLWDGHNGRLVAWLEHAGVIHATAFNESGTLIATAGRDKLVKIWATRDGKLLRTIAGHTGLVFSVAFDAAGGKLLTAAADNDVRIWDVESGQLLQELKDESLGTPTQAVFSPGEKSVAIAAEGGNTRIWSPKSGGTLTLKGHQQAVTGVRYSSGGELLFTYSEDGTARAWDVRNGLSLGIVGAHATPIMSLDASPDFHRLATTSWSRIAFWDIASELRSATETSKILRCRAPWQLDSNTNSLQASKIPSSECR